MLFAKTTFIGIDPTAGERPFSYAALDHSLAMLALGEGGLDEVLAFAAGQQEAYVAVCAPRQPNTGVLQREEVRQALSPPPRPGRWSDFRLAEYLLRQRKLNSPKTPAVEETCPRWMKMGFALFRRLESFGYQTYPAEQANRQVMEVYPHACYAALAGVLPLSKHSLEGRLQRQLLLFDREIGVSDPMIFFEEITRHRLRRGILPLGKLHTPGELDALVAAYTAWLAATSPNQVDLLGDPGEGQIAIPVHADVA